ncbi:hypothetical protein C8R44DRAFT_881033 [Mycena epipterygia]|nr:hypothetical protein C8R44DRAFT_881033 [Mycena epipterygia]
MSDDTAFKKSDWIGLGKPMASAPPMIRRAARDTFTIPHSLRARPELNENAVIRLRRLPIPEAKVVHRLVESSRQAWLDGFESITYNHLSDTVVTHFPLWVLTYWKAVVDFRRDVRGPWVKSSDWLGQQKKLAAKKNLAHAGQVEAALLLHMLPWGWAKPPGLSDAEPLHNLHRFLGPNWLTGSQQNDMLELLRHKIDNAPALVQKFRIQGTALAPKILEAYDAGAQTYKASQDFRWLRAVADDLVRNQAVLISTAHLGEIAEEPHWTALTFDLSQHVGKISYGDSFDDPISRRFLEALRWWMGQHTEAHLEYEKLPIGTQTDGFSCGMLVDNGQEHLVDPKIPLIEKGGNFAHARVRTFNKIGQWLEIERARAIAEDEDSDDRSDQYPYTSSHQNVDDSDSDSDAPILLRHVTKNAKFTFTSPISSPETTTTTPSTVGVKRAKGHPDAPTPSPSPQKRRIYKRGSDDAVRPPSFGIQLLSLPMSPCALGGRVWVDYEGHGEGGDDDDDVWGPDDDAQLAPTSQFSQLDDSQSDSFTFFSNTTESIDAAMGTDTDTLPELLDHPDSDNESVLPDLKDPSCSDDSDEEAPPQAPPSPTVDARPRLSHKITGFFKVETAAEKVVRMERETREYMERAEANRLREMNAGRMKAARKRADATERMQHFRDQAVDLVDYDRNANTSLAEVSCPRRQFKEDTKKNKKLSGRKQKEKNKKRDSKLTNWFHPLLWPQIVIAAARAGKLWKPCDIVREARKLNMGAFWKLTEQVVGTWMDREAKKQGVSKWKDSVLKNVENRKGNAPGGVEQPYPEIRKLINDHLTSLCDAGVVLTILTIRALMVAHIERGAPGLLGSAVGSDSTKFRCSESFTQLVYQQGAELTWNKRGAKQVATVGQEEKQAFTLVPSILASGVLLPMQAVFMGKTTASCPSRASKHYHEAIALGYSMVPSLTSTYWSNHGTMHELVDTQIAPYFDAVKKQLGLSPKQFSIWKIDYWSVHKPEAFRDWMKKNHPTIIFLFVPGGCTGLVQTLDLGEIEAGKAPSEIKLNTMVGVLRDRSVGWIVQTIKDLSDPEIIMKVFEMCRVGDSGFNFSQASLTLPEALERLIRLPTEDPVLYAEISQRAAADLTEDVEEDPYLDVDIYDDCDIPLDVVSEFLTSSGTSIAKNFTIGENGGLARAGDAEKSDAEADEVVPVVLGCGQRKRVGTRRYDASLWEGH